MDRRYMNPSLFRFRQFLVILAEPSAPAEPGQCVSHHLPAGQHLELVAARESAYTCNNQPPVAQAHVTSRPA